MLEVEGVSNTSLRYYNLNFFSKLYKFTYLLAIST